MSFNPIQKSERSHILDILRGFAILGIFIMNLEGFTFYWTLSESEKANVMMAEYDHSFEFFNTMFLEGKFYSIFSMLFGIGFAIYLSKADQNKGILGLFTRRLFILLIIGFIHLMFWTGDIVAFYAIVGFMLIPFRKLGNKTILIIAAFCLLSPIAWYALKWHDPKTFDLSVHLYNTGDLFSRKLGINSPKEYYNAMVDVEAGRFFQINFAGIFYRFGDLVFQSRIFKVFGMFLIGLVVGRTKLFSRINENRKLLMYIFISGLIMGLPSGYILAVLKQTKGGWGFSTLGMKQTVAYAFNVAPLALAYTSGIALLYNGAGKRFLSMMAPAGRMALTNYLFQTFTGIILFTGLGFAFPPIGPAAGFILAIAVFIVQIFLSTIWLRYFNFGPVEWLWRSATYGKWQPMKKVPLS